MRFGAFIFPNIMRARKPRAKSHDIEMDRWIATPFLIEKRPTFMRAFMRTRAFWRRVHIWTFTMSKSNGAHAPRKMWQWVGCPGATDSVLEDRTPERPERVRAHERRWLRDERGLGSSIQAICASCLSGGGWALRRLIRFRHGKLFRSHGCYGATERGTQIKPAHTDAPPGNRFAKPGGGAERVGDM